MKNLIKTSILFLMLFTFNIAKADFELSWTMNTTCVTNFQVFDAGGSPLTLVLSVGNPPPVPGTCFAGTPSYIVFNPGCSGSITQPLNSSNLVSCCSSFNFNNSYNTTGTCSPGNGILQVNYQAPSLDISKRFNFFLYVLTYI